MKIQGGARTAVDITGQTAKFKWEIDDKIKLYSGEYTANEKGEVISMYAVDTDGQGTFWNPFEKASTLHAYYPGDINRGNDESVTLPAEYTCNLNEKSGAYHTDVNALLYGTLDLNGTTSRQTMEFNHLAGVFAFTVNDVPNTVKSLVFTDSDNRQITGDFVINAESQGGNSQITAGSGSGKNEITIKLNASDWSGETQRNITFYIPLPVAEYANFTLKFMDSSNSMLKKKTVVGKEFKIARKFLVKASTALDYGTAGDWDSTQ